MDQTFYYPDLGATVIIRRPKLTPEERKKAEQRIIDALEIFGQRLFEEDEGGENLGIE